MSTMYEIWITRFACMGHEERLLTIAEDPSTLDAVISEARRLGLAVATLEPTWERRAGEYERLAEEAMEFGERDVLGRFRGREQATRECLSDLRAVLGGES